MLAVPAAYLCCTNRYREYADQTSHAVVEVAHGIRSILDSQEDPLATQTPTSWSSRSGQGVFEPTKHMARTTVGPSNVRNMPSKYVDSNQERLNRIGAAFDLRCDQSGTGRKERCPHSLLSTHKVVTNTNLWKARTWMAPMSLPYSCLGSPLIKANGATDNIE